MSVLDISCDEAGHTGPDLLNAEQRFFGFSSVNFSDEEAWELIQKARKNYQIQMPELKAARLLRSKNGRLFIADLVRAANGRFIVNVHDKLLALCGWLFEYIYEPVYQDDPWLLYEKNLHRFVAMFAWLWFNDSGEEAKQAISQFQKYMRSRNVEDAPLLFNKIRKPLSHDGMEHPFELVLRFAHGYQDRIIADNMLLEKTLPDAGRWTLDLSTSALWSHLNYWGRKGKPLRVRCDDSKPLAASFSGFTGDENDPGTIRARMAGHTGPLGYKLSEPVSFVDSRSHPAVQLADVFAGITVFRLAHGIPDGFEDVIERINEHLLPDTILPDLEIIDLRQRIPAVNSLILYDLAARAERGLDPYVNLGEMYRAAEISWAQGNFRLFGSNSEN
jgi:hypothetical protein